MEINSTRFGVQEISSDTVIEMPNGMVGFEGLHKFKLFHNEESESPNLFWLQSIDDADISFAVTDPELFNVAFEFTLSDEESELLQLGELNDLSVMLLVYRGDESMGELLPQPKVGAPSVRASLTGPILINTAKCIGLQKVFPRISYTTIVREA
ncbi:hypothetical protein BOW53_10645 [Solemya pervernicosa gill symbiont]|uniref:Flagellar assembly factor FliW n=2 Tax=Gammaproteobacteria incertae sedis TaxID=118884 RepID=A0A1T2L3K3_9GAMM|nr:flagellar assembly protein FliW [Candidatus Reidiella endopervernicosa]OOZ39664.1 hypothetical protein BOW53_10645 [Solemya pervernicosa gill symbiont]QKQ27750.1 flagellar assembly protein FliW [Candidatus Reidiella endopervernicosa]